MSLLKIYFENEHKLSLGEELIKVAIAGTLEELKEILDKDPECVNFQDPQTGLTALHIARQMGTMSSLIFFVSNQR